jgi:hypothetical protein
MAEVAEFAREARDGVMLLFAAEGCARIALEDSTVIAVVLLQSDGEIQAHLSAIVVAEAWRSSGLGRGISPHAG